MEITKLSHLIFFSLKAKHTISPSNPQYTLVLIKSLKTTRTNVLQIQKKQTEACY